MAFVCLPLVAHANGRPAATIGLGFGGPRIAVATTFGALVSDDGGGTWRLICEGPLGTADSVVDPLLRLPAAGLLVESTDFGVYFSRNDGCDWATSSGSVSGESISDLAASPTDAMRLLATTSTGAARNGIHVSQDGGASFAAVMAAPAQTVFRGVRFGSATRVYALAYDITGSATHLYVSNDAGASFTATAYSATGETGPTLLAVRDQTVYYWAQRGSTLAILRSTDGGVTFAPTGWNVSRVHAAAFGDDGALYLATDTGVRKTADGQTLAPAPTGAIQVTCLESRGGALYGCATESDGFALGRSTDGGATWTALLHFGSSIVGPLACAPGTQVCTTCYPLWSTFASQLGLPNTAQPQCAAPPDGAPAPDGGNHASPSGTGACAIDRGDAVGATLLLAIAMCLSAYARRRRSP